jgi:hypothetical protein
LIDAKLKFAEEALVLNEKLKQECSKTKNPQKCVIIIDKKIEHIRTKIFEYKQKISFRRKYRKM